MSMNDLIAATQAMNEQTDRMRTFMDGLDAEIATRQGAYDALAGDLAQVVEDKLDQRIYVDAGAGDNSAAGTSVAPVATIQEAFGRLVPGCVAEIRLKRGDTYQIGRDALQCDAENGYVSIQTWGDAALELPYLDQQLDQINGAGYSSGLSGRGLNLYVLSCRVRAAMNPGDLPLTTFNGVFTGIHNSSLTLHSCELELGDVDMIKTGYGEPVHVSIRSSTITRQAGATGKLLSASAGILRATSVTLPAGETWADMVTGQVYAADGEARNFITNVQI